MKLNFIKSFATFILVCGVIGYLQLLANANHIAATNSFLHSWVNDLEPLSVEEQRALLQDVHNRSDTYLERIQEHHLDAGMIVNRHLSSNEAEGRCDSLLFSSLYYVSLKKFGYESEAQKTWRAIEKSQKDGAWQRHPKCGVNDTSRDMIIGLLMALTQKPSHYRTHLEKLFMFMGSHHGFIGHGPLFASYVSPGLAEILRKFAREEAFSNQSLPTTIRSSFSTMELNAGVMRVGFRSHLSALQAFIELELADQNVFKNQPETRSITHELNRVTQPFLAASLTKQRLEYITQSLFEKDPKNLFFKYLRYRSAGVYSEKIKFRLLKELLAMEQFPAHRLPTNCDRKADWLWQRQSGEYQRISSTCTTRYSGADFLFLSAVILKTPNQLGDKYAELWD